MSREDMIALIISFVSIDENLIKVLRIAVGNNINQLSDTRLAELISIINNQPS